MKKSNRNTISELAWYFLTILITGIAVTCVLQLWNRNLHIPFEYTEDGLGPLIEIKNMLLGNDWYHQRNLGAPFEMITFDFKGYNLHFYLIMLISLFTKNLGLIVNIYYLVTFLLTAVASFYVLRKLAINRLISLVGSVLYSCLPYHFLKGEMHLFLGSYYIIPLACLALLYLFEGELCSENFREKQKISFKNMLQSANSTKMWFCIIVAALLGISDIYYSAFFCMILAFCGLYILVSTKQFRQIYFMILMGTTNLIAVILSELPVLQYLKNGGTSEFANNRSIWDVDRYGLRLAQLLLPISSHRISAFAKVRQIFDNSAENILANNEVSLGICLGLGLVGTFVILLFKFKDSSSNISMRNVAKINLFTFMLGTMGGLNVVVGIFVTVYIRAYYRIVVYIAMFSLIFISMFLNNIYKGIKKNMVRCAFSALIILVLIFGVLDQTSAEYAYGTDFNYINSYASNISELSKQYISDENFVSSIESQLEDSAMILELPLIGNDIVKNNQFPNGVEHAYDLFRPYLHSTDTKWSFSAVYNSDSTLWQECLSQLTTSEMLKAAAFSGFSGIYIESRGYNDADFTQLINEINRILNATPMESEVGGQYFYNMTTYVKELKETYSESEWRKLHDACLGLSKFDVEYYSADNSSIGYVNGEVVEKTFATIAPGSMQFGPYVHLSPGNYLFTVKGRNLNAASFDVVYNSGEGILDIEIISQTNSKIVYTLKNDVEIIDLECRLFNNTENKEIMFENILIESQDNLGVKDQSLSFDDNEMEYTSEFSIFKVAYGEINSPGMQYGPYLKLEKGNYQVTVYGQNLSTAAFDACYNNGNSVLEILVNRVSDESITYQFNLSEDISDFECRVFNNTNNSEIIFESIYIEKTDNTTNSLSYLELLNELA